MNFHHLAYWQDKALSLAIETRLFINGEYTAAAENETFETVDPVTQAPLAKIARGKSVDIDRAVSAARGVFERGDWSLSSPAKRKAVLNKLADLMEAHAEELALLETLDTGKPIRHSLRDDIPGAARAIRWYAEAIDKVYGEVATTSSHELAMIVREPVGVIAAIVPWNFPFLMAAWKLAPVLAAGDCTILKPSKEASLSILEFARLIDGVLPAGVFNVITGAGSKTGQYMLEHKGFAKLAFTGSTEVGRNVGLAAAERIIPATLELGGKSANIYFDDCDFDQAIDGAQLGILFNQGQVCCAGSRIFVQDTIYDKFVPALVQAFNKVKVGLPWNDDTQMGSQINETQIKKILSYVEIAKQEGATIACGGERFTEGELAKGAFMKPTLITNVTNDMRVAQEEIFGPVAVVIKFHDEDEVVAMANDSEYGLGGAVWTKDINKAIRVARNVETGRMWVNTYNQIPEHSPFGGYKTSGIGRETHKMILNHYTQVKNIMINLSYAPSGFYPQD